MPELEAADPGAPSSGPVDLFRELLEERKGVPRGNREHEEEKRREKVSWPHFLVESWGCGLAVTVRIW